LQFRGRASSKTPWVLRHLNLRLRLLDRGAPPPRLCLGLFAAADALGLGFLHGVAPHLYIERLEPSVLERVGLSLEAPGSAPDVYVRIPAVRESVFRGAVRRDGVPVSDVVQVWLDAGANPSRGSEQADLIYRRVLKPLIDRRPQ
jgi:hypothetical protein